MPPTARSFSERIIRTFSKEDRVKADELEELKSREWPFDLKIALSPQRLFPGANRNIAGLLATGDLFICQNADDIPHSQRAELIRKFFFDV